MLIRQKIEKNFKNLFNFFKSSRQSPIKFDDLEAIIKQLMTLITR